MARYPGARCEGLKCQGKVFELYPLGSREPWKALKQVSETIKENFRGMNLAGIGKDFANGDKHRSPLRRQGLRSQGCRGIEKIGMYE